MPAIFDHVIEKIINSAIFSNKEVLKGLLKYLYQAYLKGEVVNESILAADYFKRGADFLKGEDTIVRVSIHKLRLILEKYYTEEGLQEMTKVTIPKGSYSLVFTQTSPKKQEKLKLNKTVAILFGALILVLSVISSYFYYKDKINNISIWNEYFDSSSVNILLGDPFFYRVKDTTSKTGSLIVRDITINSKEDLNNKLPTHKNINTNDFAELSYPYFSKNNISALPEIITIFAEHKIESRLQTLSEVNLEDLKRENVIFLANINSFGLMSHYLERTSLRLYTDPRKIVINDNGRFLTLTVPETVKGYYMDYAFLIRKKSNNGKVISLIGDFHASGIKGLIRYISDQATLHPFRKKVIKSFGEFPQSFEMVVKVTSYNYIDFETEVIYFKPLSLIEN